MEARANIEQRLAYLEMEPADLELLAELEPILTKHATAFVAAFYRQLLSFPETRRLLSDPDVKERLLAKQRGYLLSLARPALDERYVSERRRIGEVHEQIGLEPRWYLGAYSLYFSLLAQFVWDEFRTDSEKAPRILVALQKLLTLDAQLAMETYIERHQRELEYLNEELALQGRELGREKRAQGAELRRTRERAHVAEELASIGTLAAGLAHEIGTPMGVIQGHAKLLESAVSGSDGEWRLRTIQEQVARISRIIQTLLNLARPGPARSLPVTLEPLLENTLSFLSEKLTRRGVEVARAYAPAPSILGDAERLQQLFLNLLLNACDAMPDGGRLAVRLHPEGAGDVAVHIADTGAGIDPGELPRIFEPFFTTKPAGEGNGLGLMIAQRIVKEHGGQIDVESEVGRGTVFRIVFPAAG
jgi:signal transduction histidine kinase